MTQTELDELVKEITKTKTVKAVNLSLRGLQELINAKTGETPNTTLLAESMRRNGLQVNGHRWVWRHNPGRGE